MEIPGNGDRPLRLVLVADPGLPYALAQHVGDDLPSLLTGPGAEPQWRVSPICQRIPGADTASVGDVLAADWDRDRREPGSGPVADMTILFTDQPLRAGRDPIVAETAVDADVALVSLPAVGALWLRRRIAPMVARLVVDLSQARTHDPDDRMGGAGPGRWFRSFRRVVVNDERVGVRYVGGGPESRLRLLAGMVRDNRPWRLVPSLSGAFAAALGTAGLVLVNQTVWKLAATLGKGHLIGATVLAVAAMVAWLIVEHRMWERGSDFEVRPPVGLYNATTVLTLTLGVLCLYAGLLVVGAVAQSIVLAGGPLAQSFGHPVGWGDRARLVWLATSMATVGGALGSGFETDEAVRLAAYGYRQRERRRQQDDDRARRGSS